MREYFSLRVREYVHERVYVCVEITSYSFGLHLHPCIIVLASQSYEIWQPNLNVIEANIPGMMEHLSKMEIL